LKNGFKGGQGKGFAEASGPGEKINASGIFNQFKQVFGFIDVQIILFDQFTKSGHAGGQVLFHDKIIV
jgi:hypothetical protein